MVTKLDRISRRGVRDPSRAVRDPSRAGRLFPALLAPSRTALMRGFLNSFAMKARAGPYRSYDNTSSSMAWESWPDVSLSSLSSLSKALWILGHHFWKNL